MKNCLPVILAVAVLFAAPVIAQPPAGDHSGEQEYTNALINETSPYLLMHAHNPVNWYGWNEETLALARSEDKLIFLSVGYSSCHWCHVMERESFMDEEIAAFLNENFICVKVDREERPDVDDIYMTALHAFNRMSGRRDGGGWPLSMFLTPDGMPFFGGTYFPARTGDRGTSTGFLTIVTKIHETWTGNKDGIISDAEKITEATRAELAGAPESDVTEVDPGWIGTAIRTYNRQFDPEFGGTPYNAMNRNLPKFPQPSNLMFFVSAAEIESERDLAQKMLIKTCDHMMMGGIYDHIGGGFHRYSVDRFWRIPHFEKMLYDNGQLVSVYAALYEMTGRQEYRDVVEQTLAFVDREMTSPEGGFYSALDAESEGEEGKFYRWTKEELQEALTEEELEFFARYYGINNPPNFEGVYYAPQLAQLLSIHANAESTTLEAIQAQLAPIRQKLFDIRARRERPLTDTKILTAWNGMMIRGYADAGRILENEAYVETAARAADFVWNNLLQPDGRLWRTYTAGEAKLNGYLDDYACLIESFIALHRATDDEKWLMRATRLQSRQDELFLDREKGGYFFTSSDHETLLVRGKKPTDGALPSGNSIAANNLLYLSQYADTPDAAEVYRERANRAVLSVASMIERFPVAAPRILIASQKLLMPPDTGEPGEMIE
ncbi:MAG: thioredoxin domain-containing protein [Planctomycetota bacterium]